MLREHGLRFSFHNHAVEMALHEGRTVFDWMLGAAQPRNLSAEPDVYWIHVGGQSPGKFLRAHGARCPLVHLKDETELGLGPVDFSAVFAATESIGAAEWYVVEQEKYTRTYSSNTSTEGACANSFNQGRCSTSPGLTTLPCFFKIIS